MRKWADEEVDFLKKNYHIIPIKEISSILNRSDKKIISKASSLGISKTISRLDLNQIDFIKEHYGKISPAEIADKLGIKVNSVTYCADKLNLKRRKKKFKHDNEVLKIISESQSWVEVKRKLGYSKNVTFIKILNSIKNKLGKEIDISHFTIFSRYQLGENRRRIGIESIFNTYKTKAIKIRKLEWSLSIDEFTKLVNDKCFYCHKNGNSKHGKHIYCGIDRVDSTKGYIKSNCVPCCKICNHAKRRLTQSQFINHFSDMIDYQRSLKSATPLTSDASPVKI